MGLPRVWRLLTVASLLASAACDRSVAPTTSPVAAGAPLTAQVAAYPSVQLISCTANVVKRAIDCGGTATGAPVVRLDSTIVGGRHTAFVTLVRSGVTYSSQVFGFDLVIQSAYAQKLGTLDGTTLDSRGVRLFIGGTPVVTGGSGTVGFTNPSTGASFPDSIGAFTAAGQPFYQYDVVLAKGAKTGVRRVQFGAPSTVRKFTFTVGVSAAVQYPFGWVTASPASVSLGIGGSAAASGMAYDVNGVLNPGAAITWTSRNPAVATVSGTGTIAGVAGGTTVVEGTSLPRAAGLVNVTVTGNTPTPPPGSIAFSVNTSTRFNISRFIYGINLAAEAPAGPWYGAFPPNEVTLDRFGGNRLSAYNWENNYSNAGNDYLYQNDNSLSSSTQPGAAVRTRVSSAASRGAGMVVTVPMLGYVAADAAGPMDILDATRTTRLATRFRVSSPAKGSAFSLTPNAGDPFVYQDEFVNWVDKSFPGAITDPQKPIFFSLDNEPDIWHSTHEEVQSDSSDNPNRPRLQSYDGFIKTTIAYANAVKAVTPGATIFGPVVATYAGVTTLGRWPSLDPMYGSQSFFDVYLDRLRQAEGTYGRRLVDVLDLHWYPAAGSTSGSIVDDYAPQDPAMINARLQAPRSLWDPSYNENSWVNQVTGGPIYLLPRLRGQINAHYPGTKVAITEYYYGRGGDISGGIAQADVLGIFGREGVFAATLWPLAGVWASPYNGSGAKAYAYAFGAFRMFLNFDGSGGRFGDIGVTANTADAVNSSVYASLDAAGRVVLVAINKKSVAQVAFATVSHSATLRTAQVYSIDATTASPVRRPDIALTAGNTLTYSMPPLSVTTLVLVP